MTAVTREHRGAALERIKSDPFVKRLGFERFESRNNERTDEWELFVERIK